MSSFTQAEIDEVTDIVARLEEVMGIGGQEAVKALEVKCLKLVCDTITFLLNTDEANPQLLAKSIAQLAAKEAEVEFE